MFEEILWKPFLVNNIFFLKIPFMIRAKNITKTYVSKGVETRVLRGIDLHIQKGEFVAIMGRSGAGKSTLLYQLSLLDTPTAGKVFLSDEDTSHLSNEERTRVRLCSLGYVFQDYALIPDLTTIENVMIPLLMQGESQKKAEERALKALLRVELAHRRDNLPSQLSGGEQQRAAIARAVVHDPDIIFADEPTANLDTFSSQAVLNLLLELHKKGQTIVMVTHEEEYGALAQRIIRLSDGLVVP